MTYSQSHTCATCAFFTNQECECTNFNAWEPFTGNENSRGNKFDISKPNMALISPLALAYLSQVLTFGATKYKENNWRKGLDQTKLIAAALRHITAFAAGLEVDPETGLPHMAHAMCCCMFSLELQESESNIDTRYQYTENQKDLLAALLANDV